MTCAASSSLDLHGEKRSDNGVRADLQLIDERSFRNGTVYLCYRVPKED